MTDRRPWKKKLIALVAVVAGILILLLARCAGAFGDGDDGERKEAAIDAAASVDEAPPKPCMIRVDADGVKVEGKATAVEDVATACDSKRAQLTVTGDARHGDAKAVRAKLRSADIEFLERR